MDPNEDFDILDDREHAYRIQRMHIGSDKKNKREEYVYDETGIHEMKVKTPPGVYQIFYECLDNAGDNIPLSIEKGYEYKRIIVNVTDTRVTIRNGGVPIPIAINKKSGLYVPEMLCSKFRTSSHYNEKKKRQGVGTNGFGIKEINTFSKKFTIKVGDADRKLEYSQTWTNNMKSKEDPKITKYSGSNYVEFSYDLDFARFDVECYSERDIAHFKARAADLSFYYGIPIKFNGEVISFESLEDYGRLYFNPTFTNNENFAEDEASVRDHIVSFEDDVFRIIIADTPEEGKIVSIVNGRFIKSGGAHVKKVTNAVCKKFLDEAKKSYSKKFKEANKKSVSKLLNVKKILPHLSFIIVCKTDDPDWDGGQVKTGVATFDGEVKVPKKVLEAMKSWSFITELENIIEQRATSILAASDGKKGLRVENEGAIVEAGYAGHKTKWKECILIIVEGKSASMYPKEMLRYIPGGRRIIGIMPIKGKVLNLRKASVTQIEKNKEYRLLKHVLGLREGVDYSKEENFNTLKYGKVMVLADGDPDGDHIRALIYNNFYYKWPSLLKRGYLFIKRTPYLVATKGKETKTFYYPQDYEKFLKKDDAEKWTIDWYKGLATSTRKDVGRDMEDPKYTIVTLDKHTGEKLTMAFDNKCSNQRKLWLENSLDNHPSKAEKISMSIFIDTELIRFAFADLIRCIPGYIDGLKPGQRKVVWGIIRKMGYNPSKKVCVENLGNIVAAETQYHYGPKSLNDTIMRMTQNFVGACNLPLLADDGQNGTRDEGGKDAGATRYVKTKTMPYFQYIFRREDEPILNILEEEGYKIEPKFMLPVIPLLACNGPIGIGFAYSCFFANHNPLEIIKWIKCKLRDETTPTLVPWYHGFTGEIEIHDKASKLKEHEDDEEDSDDGPEGNGEGEDIPDAENVLVDKSTKKVMITKGIFEKNNDGVKITELPVGVWTNNYRISLNKMKKDKIIRKFDDDCNGGDTINFTIKGMHKPNHKKLKLVKSFGLSNMVALDENYKPIKFDDVEQILETFYKIRLPFYQKRKDHQLGEMKSEIAVLNEKMKLLRLIQEKKIKVRGRTNEDVKEQLEKYEVNPDLVMGKSGLALKDITVTNIKLFEKKVLELKGEYKKLKETDIKDIWMSDLEELAKQVKKYYKD